MPFPPAPATLELASVAQHLQSIAASSPEEAQSLLRVLKRRFGQIDWDRALAGAIDADDVIGVFLRAGKLFTANVQMGASPANFNNAMLFVPVVATIRALVFRVKGFTTTGELAIFSTVSAGGGYTLGGTTTNWNVPQQGTLNPVCTFSTLAGVQNANLFNKMDQNKAAT